jgi:cohesin loading factor subunit SCC2
LEAALTLAFILTSPGIDPTLIGAETIGSCVALMRHHMLKHIIPALSPINLVLNDSGRQPGSEKTDGSNKMNTASRKRSIRKISAAEKTLQNAESYSHIFELAGSILSFVDVFTNLMDKMDYLCHKVQFEDQQLLAIVDTCLRTITLDPFSSNCFSADRALTLIRSLHGCVISLMTTIFHLHSRLREGILQDILPLILKLPTSSKKSVRYFQVSSYYGLCASGTTSENNSRLCSNYRADVHIQTLSVLILQIIQSAVSMPNASNLEGLIDVSQNSEHANCSKQELELKSQDAIQGLGFCKKAIAYVVTELITRCNKKTDEASEFRTFLSNFIEDLLLINLNPEYPAAEAMLHALCNQILDMILQCSSIGSPNKVNSKVLLVEGGFLVSAVDILGSVSADIAYKRLCLRKHPVKLPKTPSDKCEKIASVQSNPSKSRQEGHVDDFSFRADDCGCICDRKFVDTFMLDCDQCHRWFHGSCVGIPRDKPLKIWVCDDCRLYERIWKQANSLCTPYACATDREFSQRDHIQIMRLVLLQDLNKKSRLINHMLGLKCARWYWLAHWLESSLPQKQVNDVIESRVLSRRFLSDWYFPGEKHSLMQAVDDSAFETPANILLSLFCFSSSLACFYPQLLAFLIAITGDLSAGLRKAGVRALAQVIDVDSNLMNQREVRDVVAKMLLDDFISVREAAITLVSKFMNRVPQLCNVFHGILLDRLNNDTGVSVVRRFF